MCPQAATLSARRLQLQVPKLQVRCAELLLNAGAILELPAGPPGGWPTTLLHLAVRSGCPRPLGVVLRRLQTGAAASSGTGGTGDTAGRAGTAGTTDKGGAGGKGGTAGTGGRGGRVVALVDRVDGEGATPLCTAVCAHAHECVRLLLRHSARLLARDAAGATPLHYAVVSGDAVCTATLLAAAAPTARRTLLAAADPTQARGSLAHLSPLIMAAGRRDGGGVLEAMVRAAPALFGDAAELSLHLRLFDAAMEAPCEAAVALLMRHCAPLQRRLLPLMKLCARSCNPECPQPATPSARGLQPQVAAGCDP